MSSNRRHWTRRRPRGDIRCRLESERGSVAAETAIAIPILVAVLVFAGVLIGRGVDARLQVNDAAAQAARAASLTRTPSAASTAATQTADQALSGSDASCQNPAVSVDVAQFRPGGVVTVTVSCHLDLSQAALLGVPVSKTLTATASSPIDTFRATAVGLASPTTNPVQNPAGTPV